MSQLPPQEHDYLEFLNEVKTEISKKRINVARTANQQLIQLYWWLGKTIAEKQEKLGWGKYVVEQLAHDLRVAFDSRSGFSAQNLWYMRQFFLEYQEDTILQQLVGELPWGHNLTIMSKVKDKDARYYYLKSSLEMGWSRNVLLHQIKSQGYERHKLNNKQHNFYKALPEHLAEQADQAMKNPH